MTLSQQTYNVASVLPASLLVLSLISDAIHAGTVVSNLSESTIGQARLTNGTGTDGSRGVEFRTDGQAYRLDSVTLNMNPAVDDSGSFVVQIYDTSDSNPEPGSVVATLTGSTVPDPTAATDYVYSATNVIHLSANTSYWVVAGVSSGAGIYNWNITGSQDQDGSWAIGNKHKLRSSNNWNDANFIPKISVNAVPALTVDYNANGIVDAADYTVWRDLLGLSGVGLAADGDGDGEVTSLDYDLWKAHFGQTLGSGSAATNSVHAAVPEPSTCMLAMIALTGLWWSAIGKSVRREPGKDALDQTSKHSINRQQKNPAGAPLPPRPAGAGARTHRPGPHVRVARSPRRDGLSCKRTRPSAKGNRTMNLSNHVDNLHAAMKTFSLPPQYRRFILLCLAFSLGSVLLPSRSLGVIKTWDGGHATLDFFDVDENWDSDVRPGGADTAVFSLNSTYDVEWDHITEQETPSVYWLHVLDGNVTFLNVEDPQEPEYAQFELIVEGIDFYGGFNDIKIEGPTTSLTIDGIHLISQGKAELTMGATLTVDGASDAGAAFTTLHPVDPESLRVNGTLNVAAGGVVTNTGSIIAYSPGTVGSAAVTGSGSQWNNSKSLFVGYAGNGTLNVAAGGLVSSRDGEVGFFSTGVATVTGSGSQWNNSGTLWVGSQDGTLNVEAGGLVSNSQAYVGGSPGSFGSVTVDGTDAGGNPSTWDSSDDLFLGARGNGSLQITGGGLVSSVYAYVGESPGSFGSATVDGTDSDGNPSFWNNSDDLLVGYEGDGLLQITGGGLVVTGSDGAIGWALGSTGAVTIAGADASGNPSTWSSSNALAVGVYGDGTLDITDGGLVSSHIGSIGAVEGSTGAVSVSGTDSIGNPSTWMTDALGVGGSLFGDGGTGTLTVANQSLVEVAVTLKIGSLGTVTLDGGSIVTQAFDNTHGGTFNFLSGSLTINDGITVGSDPSGVFPSSTTLNSDHHLTTIGTTTIAPFRTLTLDGGTLQTGDLNIQGTLAFNSGTLRITAAGGLTVGPAGPFGTSLSIGNGQNLEVANTLTVNAGATVSLASGVHLSAGAIESYGRLTGTGTLTAPLQNLSGGEVETLAGEHLRFAAGGNSNFGEIHNFGGQIRFDGSLVNDATGFIAGRGQFVAGGGWTNQGIMAFSAGVADVLGNVSNDSGGQIITSGGATTTFFDDVVHNGLEIRTAAGSSTVILGLASGAGPYTGTGTVFFEGNLQPGSSPGAIELGGDVVFGSLLTSQFELAGIATGEFDQLNVADDLVLDGALEVELINDFTPALGNSFEILAAGGELTGTFASTLLPDLGMLLIMDVFYDTNTVTLAVVPALAGDYNANGVVNAADYTVWRDMLGQTGVGLAADGNGDRMITQLDYDVWKAHFGQTAGGGLAAAGSAGASPSHSAVPEPSSLAIYVVGLAVAAAGASRKRINTRRR